MANSRDITKEYRLGSKNDKGDSKVDISFKRIDENDKPLLQVNLYNNYQTCLTTLAYALDGLQQRHVKLHSQEKNKKISTTEFNQLHDELDEQYHAVEFVFDEMVRNNNPDFAEIKKNNGSGEVKISATGLFAALNHTNSKHQSQVKSEGQNEHEVEKSGENVTTNSPKH